MTFFTLKKYYNKCEGACWILDHPTHIRDKITIKIR